MTYAHIRKLAAAVDLIDRRARVQWLDGISREIVGGTIRRVDNEAPYTVTITPDLSSGSVIGHADITMTLETVADMAAAGTLAEKRAE